MQSGAPGALALLTQAELEVLDGATVTTTELNLLDGGTDVASPTTTIVDADRFIINDNGTMTHVSASVLKAYIGGGGGGGTAADDISTGDAAVNISTTTGDITLDTNDGDIILDPAGKDVIFKVTGSDYLKFTMEGEDTVITGSRQNGDLVFSFNGSEYLRMGTDFENSNGNGLALSSGNSLLLTNGANIRFDSSYGQDHYLTPGSSTYGFGLSGDGALVKISRYGSLYLRDKYSIGGDKSAIFLQSHGGKVDFFKGNNSSVGGPYSYNQLAPLDVSNMSGRDRMLLLSGSFASDSSVITHFNVGDLGTTSAIEISGSGDIIKIGQDSPSSGEFLKWDGTKVVWDTPAGGGGGGGGGKHGLTSTETADFTTTAFGTAEERQLYIVDSSSAVTATLAAPGNTTYDGYEINIKRFGTGAVHITGSTGVIGIDGSATFDLPSQFSSVTLIATGSQFVII